MTVSRTNVPKLTAPIIVVLCLLLSSADTLDETNKGTSVSTRDKLGTDRFDGIQGLDEDGDGKT